MARTKNDIVKSVRKFLLAVQEKGIKVDRAFVFGSQVRGDANIYSDIDLAIVSKDFTGNRVLDAQPLDKLIWDIDVRIEPFAFRPEDFTEDDPLAYQIIKYGKEIPIPSGVPNRGKNLR